MKVERKPESWLQNRFECRVQSSVGVKLKDKGIGRCLSKSFSSCQYRLSHYADIKEMDIKLVKEHPLLYCRLRKIHYCLLSHAKCGPHQWRKWLREPTDKIEIWSNLRFIDVLSCNMNLPFLTLPFALRYRLAQVLHSKPLASGGFAPDLLTRGSAPGHCCSLRRLCHPVVCLLTASAIFRWSWHTDSKFLDQFRCTNTSNFSASGDFVPLTRSSALDSARGSAHRH